MEMKTLQTSNLKVEKQLPQGTLETKDMKESFKLTTNIA